MKKFTGWPNIDKRLFLGMHISIWLFIFVLSWLAFIRQLPLQQSMLRGFLNTIMMMALFYLIGYLYQRYYEHRRYWPFTWGVIVVFALITLIRFHINQRFSYLEATNAYYTPSRVSFFFGALVTNSIVFCTN